MTWCFVRSAQWLPFAITASHRLSQPASQPPSQVLFDHGRKARALFAEAILEGKNRYLVKYSSLVCRGNSDSPLRFPIHPSLPPTHLSVHADILENDHGKNSTVLEKHSSRFTSTFSYSWSPISLENIA